MSDLDLTRAVFRKSSRSEGANGCVEACVLGSRHLVRDSKAPESGHLALAPDAWGALLSQIKQGAYDL
ncbi:DUF397 domain-containing protein [Actinomadura viridis]|uniref:DUF397 domain-containing protein n=1 Tax=Actinomadura viridis TaxID=58110 RepID=UPI00368C6A49